MSATVVELENLTMNEKIKYVQDTLFVIGGKWKLLILMAIYEKVYRFRELQRSLPNITASVLSKELKDLEENQMIRRIVYDTYPETIEYQLTEYAFNLTPLVQEMIKWGIGHRRKITQKT